MWHIHTMEYYAGITKNTLLTHAETQTVSQTWDWVKAANHESVWSIWISKTDKTNWQWKNPLLLVDASVNTWERAQVTCYSAGNILYLALGGGFMNI